MTTHELKTVPPYWDLIEDGTKPFEVRRNDRGYQRGDRLVLLDTRVCDCGKECDRFKRSGALHRMVTYVYSGDPRFGAILAPGFVILGLAPVSDTERTEQ